MRVIREKINEDAGNAYTIILGTTEKLKSLIGTMCTKGIRYVNDVIFGINKCKLNEKSKKNIK